MDQRHLPYANKSVITTKAYFWTKGEKSEFVREVTEADVLNPVPDEYEVRMDHPLVVFENANGSGPVLVTAVQPWNLPEIDEDEGETFATVGVVIPDEESMTRLINELIRVRNERWPAKTTPPRGRLSVEAQAQEADPYSYGGTYRHPLDMD